MKKIVIFLLSSIFLYGAGLQVATPKAQMNFEKKFSNAKELILVESEPAQFTINIPIDLEPIAGRKSSDGKTASGSFLLMCGIWAQGDSDNISYMQKRDIQPGNYTTTCRFNGIDETHALKIDRYTVSVGARIEEDVTSAYILRLFDPLEPTNSDQDGIIE